MQALLDGGYPYIVAEIDGALAGYAYAGPYRPRPAYRFSVEDSIYVDPNAQRRGVGRVLLEHLIEECERRGFRQMIAVIGNSAQTPSIELHRALGFRMIGTVENVGYKFDRWLDSVNDAARARRRRDDQARLNASTRLGPLSSTRSTRSSSWPRRTIRPVADTTL